MIDAHPKLAIARNRIAALEAELAAMRDALERYKSLAVYHETAYHKLQHESEAELATVRAARDKLRSQLTIQQNNNHHRNLQLDALHHVWCSGGCEGGVHRYTHGPLTPEIVQQAVQEVDRLVRYYNNHEFRKTYRKIADPAITQLQNQLAAAQAELSNVREDLATERRNIAHDNEYWEKKCDGLSAELTAAQADSRRLDWLQRNRLIISIVLRYVSGHFDVRRAIDTAMAAPNTVDLNTVLREADMNADKEPPRG